MIVTSPLDDLRRWTRAQTEVVSKAWWVLLRYGAIIFFVDWNVDDLVVFVGTLLVVRGALTLFSVPIDGSMRSVGSRRSRGRAGTTWGTGSTATTSSSARSRNPGSAAGPWSPTGCP